MNKIKTVFYYIGLGMHSIILDFKLFTCCFPPKFANKCELISKKYILILRHLFFGIPLHPETNNISIGGRSYFYGSVFGLAVFQKMVITQKANILPLLDTIDSPVIVDVGAHLGFFSIPLASVLKKVTIYALEPVSTTFNLLTKNIKNSSSIKAFHLGLWDKPQKKRIYYNPHILLYSSLFGKRFNWDNNPHREIVVLKTLDSFCEQYSISTIDLLKIDVEGAEEKVLTGGAHALAHTRYLFIECSLDQVDNSTFSSLIGRLKGKGYNFQLVKISSTLEDLEGRLLLVNMLFRNLLFK